MFHVTAPLGAAAAAGPDEARRARRRSPPTSRCAGSRCSRSTTSRACSTACGSCSNAGAAWSSTAGGLAEAREELDGFGAPDVVIADYHLDQGDGIAAIGALREDFGRPLPAILATADRGPEARDEAARHDIVILHKPVKPAPLRAQLARMSALREAAE